MPTFSTLKSFDNVGSPSPTEYIMTNLVNYFDWGFMDKGAWFNVYINQSGIYGGNQSKLRMVSDPRYADGVVWEGFRSNWAWESGTAQPSDPIHISGIYINNVFKPVSGQTYYIDYPNGRIVFNTGIPITSNVQCEFSYKWLQVLPADNIPWFREVQYRSFRLDDSTYNQTGSGNWDTVDDIRLQLPALLIECGDIYYKPYEIGYAQYMYTNVVVHVFSEDSTTAVRLADYIGQQKELSIFLYNIDLLATSGVFPLDQRGMISSGAMTFPQLVQDYPAGFKWNKLRFSDSHVQSLNTINRGLFQKPVRLEAEVVITNM